MMTETITYQDGDVTLQGYLAFDDQTTNKRPGILVIPEAFGLGDHAKQRANRLAALGYIALAGDPFGNGALAKDLPEAMKYAGPLLEDPVALRKRARASLDKLASLPQVDASRLAMIGFCMGGTFSLEMARDGAPLRGIVSFHGGLATKLPAEAGQVKAKILVCNGADDPFVPPALVNGLAEELTKAGANWQIINYGGTVHSFTNPEADSLGIPGLAYNKQTDERSWKSMVDFFNEIFA